MSNDRIGTALSMRVSQLEERNPPLDFGGVVAGTLV
jgi:hypothetical protein